MALRVVSSRLSAVRHHSHHGIGFAKVRCPQSQLIIPSRFFSAESVSHPSNLVQVYISRSTDPYLNLSIEHFLLQKSPPDSVVLLLYTNRSCIVIGRNQNPWVEVNLGLVNQRGILRQLREENTVVEKLSVDGEGTTSVEADNDDVLLVRRRSGGGTVFHDAGNVNYSVIGPPASFDRNKHAEMVVRALQGLEKIPHGVRVNERHDIVLDVSSSTTATASPSRDTDTRIKSKNGVAKTFKISGSAYKLTRTRSLHHGTCLLSSPHLPFLSQLLWSPLAPYIKARGVESVRSPVRNVGISNTEFEDAVVAEFLAMYNNTNNNKPLTQHTKASNEKTEIGIEILDAADAEDIPEIQAGVAELRSRDWIYAQTPQFTFSLHPTADDPRPRPNLPVQLLVDANAPDLRMTVRHAEITEAAVPGAGNDKKVAESLKGLRLDHINDWRTHLGVENRILGRWLNWLFDVGG
ncbi:hypothetical protein F5Y09DRAFT_130855 [Xylaria sp. FL1042]|nr:hypothetical protein F5Y09DRAFT_130855 [Xylaria sp. FL1042]